MNGNGDVDFDRKCGHKKGPCGFFLCHCHFPLYMSALCFTPLAVICSVGMPRHTTALFVVLRYGVAPVWSSWAGIGSNINVSVESCVRFVWSMHCCKFVENLLCSVQPQNKNRAQRFRAMQDTRILAKGKQISKAFAASFFVELCWFQIVMIGL